MTTTPLRLLASRASLTAAVTTSLYACSFVVDTTGLYGGAVELPDATAVDAPVMAEVGTPPNEAGVETNDASMEADAPMAMDTGGGGFSCADAGTALCDDFDDGTTLKSQWQKEETNGNVVIQATGLSAPNAMTITQNPGGGRAYIVKAIAFTRNVHCELDMKIDAVPPARETDYFTLRTNSADHDLYVAHFDDGFALAEFRQGGTNRSSPMPTPPIGAWFHFVFDTDGNSVSVTVDGQTTTLGNLQQATGPTRSIEIGCGYAGNIAIAARAAYDNVVCTPGN